MSKLVGFFHQKVFEGRICRLATLFAEAIPQNARVLDIGAGSGELAVLILERRPDLEFIGIDVFVRPGTAIPVQPFDGKSIPFADKSFDVAIFSDVLHHTLNIEELLREAGRVAKQEVIVKDHLAETALDQFILRMMDWVGNARYGVVLPYNYLSRAKWEKAIAAAQLKLNEMAADIRLYPPWYDWLFGGRLQTMMRLVP